VPTLVTGFSTRAIAESAARNGHPIVTLDYFGDRDQRTLVENHALLRDFGQPYSARALLRASRSLDFGAVVYVSNLENHPGVVGELARGRILLGNAPAVLDQVRDPRTLCEFCREAGIPFPTTLLPGEEGRADPAVRWLCKPMRSGGGHGIRSWAGVELPPPRRGRVGEGVEIPLPKPTLPHEMRTRRR
jgi:predicted ATP-grasp superfamily ATP-dependent carboligase